MSSIIGRLHSHNMEYTLRTKAFLISKALSATVVPYCSKSSVVSQCLCRVSQGIP